MIVGRAASTGRRARLAASGVAVAVMVVGCAVSPPEGPVTATRFGGVAVVVQADSGRTVELRSGQVLEARLTNYPSQGFLLTVGTVVEPTLVQDGRPTHVDDAERSMLGGVGSFEIWRFRAGKAGRVRLQFDYRRQWETTGTPVRSVFYDVIVR